MHSTLGISPKVYVPLLVNVALGAALVALGERELGVGLLLAAASGAGFGYVASPGIVSPREIPLSVEELYGEPPLEDVAGPDEGPARGGHA